MQLKNFLPFLTVITHNHETVNVWWPAYAVQLQFIITHCCCFSRERLRRLVEVCCQFCLPLRYLKTFGNIWLQSRAGIALVPHGDVTDKNLFSFWEAIASPGVLQRLSLRILSGPSYLKLNCSNFHAGITQMLVISHALQRRNKQFLKGWEMRAEEWHTAH